MMVSLTCFAAYTLSVAWRGLYSVCEIAMFMRRDSHFDRAEKVESLAEPLFYLFIQKSFIERGLDFAMVGIVCGIGTVVARKSYEKRRLPKSGTEHQIP